MTHAINLSIADLDAALASNSKQRRIEAIEAIATRPDGASWKDQLLLIGATTQSREVWAAVRRALWGLSTSAAVQLERQTRFGGLRSYPYAGGQ